MSTKAWLAALLVLGSWVAIGALVLRGIGAPAPVTALLPSDTAFAAGIQIPQAGWAAPPPDGTNLNALAGQHGIDPPTIWVRYRFQNATNVGTLAMANEFMRERYTVFFNGLDIYRTSGSSGDLNLNWHHPVFVPLPAALMKTGENTLVFKLQSTATRPLSIGNVSIGSDSAVRAATSRRTMLETTAPQIINGVLAILTIGVLLFWLVRPKETVFGWLALVGAIWWFRNLHYFVDHPPFDNDLFWTLTTDSIFILMAVTYGFAATFLDLPNRRRIVAAMFAIASLGIVIRHLLVAAGHSDTAAFLVTIPLAVGTLALLTAACWRAPRIENLLMLGAVFIATALGFHDLLMSTKNPWTAGFYLQPYGSLLVFSAFGFALGRRMLLALAANENVNVLLEARVAEATANLKRSEASRRELQVASAIEFERERMMREIHDGIGSSLITALAVAERQQDSPGTIAVLKRSITDLRIGVDSLEPIEGDVAMLLASLRHRMERELVAAGLAFVWKVESVPVLPWLDAVAALHVLRILQEAIGNILAHAGATLIEVGCNRAYRVGDGVLVTITDNGRGFAAGAPSRGRGISNMHARAEALRAVLTCEATSAGTRISLWLPRLA